MPWVMHLLLLLLLHHLLVNMWRHLRKIWWMHRRATLLHVLQCLRRGDLLAWVLLFFASAGGFPIRTTIHLLDNALDSVFV
jgi:Na+/serine symporter